MLFVLTSVRAKNVCPQPDTGLICSSSFDHVCCSRIPVTFAFLPITLMPESVYTGDASKRSTSIANMLRTRFPNTDALSGFCPEPEVNPPLYLPPYTSRYSCSGECCVQLDVNKTHTSSNCFFFSFFCISVNPSAVQSALLLNPLCLVPSVPLKLVI